MTPAAETHRIRAGIGARIGPLLLVAIGLVLAVGFGRAWRGDLAGATAPLVGVPLPAAPVGRTAGARRRRDHQTRGRWSSGAPSPDRPWAGSSCSPCWPSRLQARTTGLDEPGHRPACIVATGVGGGAPGTRDDHRGRGRAGRRVRAVQRLGAVIVFAVAILMAAGAAVIVVSLTRAVWRAIAQSEPWTACRGVSSPSPSCRSSPSGSPRSGRAAPPVGRSTLRRPPTGGTACCSSSR